MRRKLNEDLASPVKIDVAALVNDYPKLLNKVDKIASIIESTSNDVIVSKEHTDSLYMVINGLNESEVSDLFNDSFRINDIDAYFKAKKHHRIYEDYDEEYDEDDVLDDDYAESDLSDYGLNDEGEYIDIPSDDELTDIESDEDARYAAEQDMADEYGDDYIKDYPAYDETDDDEYEYPSYEDADDIEECSEFDECEDEEFECCESMNTRRNRRRLNEKKGSCCPGKKGKMMNLKSIIESAKYDNAVNESVKKSAIKKAKAETINTLKKELGETKFNLVVNALKEGRKTLYSKKVINGKNISEYKSKELLNILNQVKEQYENLVKSYGYALNESKISGSKKKEMRENIANKKHFMELLDEELTYRLTLKKLLEDDENNPLAPLPVGPDDSGSDSETSDTDNANSEDENSSDENSSDENPEDDETVELSRVVITLASKEAADDLKQSLVDAGVPEDALEIEEESDEDSESDSDENTDETAEGEEEKTAENTEGEETSEESNESLSFGEFKSLLEDDDTDATEGDDNAEDAAEGDDNSDDAAEGDDNTDAEGSVKLILTNTDYIKELQDVLQSEYGIEKDEFEEMIGGEVVDDTEDSESDESDDSEKFDNSEESSDDSTSNGDDAIDGMSQEDLDKLFGGA